MTLQFPEHFFFGTSTSAYQIETAFEHDWINVKSEDGHVFYRTTDHEKRYREDVDLIASVAPHYRMSLMWSRLQREPLAPFHEGTTQEYHRLLQMLRARNVEIMMVIHHFVNPLWFAAVGGWTNDKSVGWWVDYATRFIDEFGSYVSIWNTFNEPNLFATMCYGVGKFPPYESNVITARKVIKNMAAAHNIIYDYIKQKYPDKSVGISHNCAVFSAINPAGTIPAKLADMWYMDYMPRQFSKVDFFGMSYYTRISFDPLAISYLYTPNKIKKYKKEHDDIWEYYPEGLEECILRYWAMFGKPIIITENGVCTNDDALRRRAIADYMQILHRLIQQNIDIRGYYHWTTWDNFEWTLGPTFRFGLYECDYETMERKKRPSADIFKKLAFEKKIEINQDQLALPRYGLKE